MASISICAIDDTTPTHSINFGWMMTGQIRTIRRRIINTSRTDSIYALQLRVVKDVNNAILIDNGSLLIKKVNTGDWIMMRDNYLDIGIMQPQEEILIDIRLNNPANMLQRGKFYIGFMMRYM
jgi:hypothetical protein